MSKKMGVHPKWIIFNLTFAVCGSVRQCPVYLEEDKPVEQEHIDY